MVGLNGTILHTTTGGTGIEPPPPPTLALPPNGSFVSTSLTLSWNPAPDALWYTLQVSTSPYFITYTVNQTNLSATSFELSGLQTEATYYWRVSVTDSTGTSGWSESWSFITEAITSVDEREEIPNKFTLIQNYPNPFNPSTMIRYGLPQGDHVRLDLFNLLGQRVALLVDGEFEAGWHETVFENPGLASGLYIYRLRAGSNVQSRKLILLR